MELLVVTWTARLAAIAAVVVAALSASGGSDPIDSVIRALCACLAFLIAGHFLLERLETPEQRLARMRAARAKARSRKGGDPAAERAIRSRTA